MPDYTSILRRSISALPDPNSEVREAVYQRARAALARQLTAVDPPLTTREIERQHHELEAAVSRIEAEFEPDAPAEAEQREEPAPEAIVAPAARVRVPAQRPEPVEPDSDDDDNASDRDTDDSDQDDEEFEDDDRRSRAPMLVGLLLLVLVVGGAAAYGIAQREALMSFLGGSGTERVETAEAPTPIEDGAPEPAPSPAVPDAAAATDTTKRPDRLTNGGEAPVEVPAAEETALLPPGAPDSPAVIEEPAIEEPQQPAPTPPPAAEQPVPQEQQTAALEQPGQSIVAQRAIFYFQGKEGSPGQATDGTVAWAQTTKDDAPAVQALLRLAERDATATVTISRNSDSTLPASHLVEIQFTGEFGPSPIQRVPALVLKQTEQARGEPLNGAAVPVTDELFWIALADNEEQIARNLQLLREGSWFDIPILFNDGTRALLTFEKGIPGDRVFETVMSTWTPS